MRTNTFTFDSTQFEKISPFYMLLDKNLTIVSFGKSAAKLFMLDGKQSFCSVFKIILPAITKASFETLKQVKDEVIFLKATQNKKITLRGNFEWLADKNKLLFIGSPWFGSMDNAGKSNLNLHDFPEHDSVEDLLNILKTHEITTRELKDLLSTINNQEHNFKNDQEELKRLSLVASLNESGVLFTDSKGLVVWCNEGFVQLTGYTIGEVMGKTPLELFKGPLSSAKGIREMLDAFSSGKNFIVEDKLYRKDGSCFWGRTRSQSILDDSGNVLQYFAIMDDITVEKEQEEILKQYEKNFRNALEKIGDNVWEYDFRTGKTFFSRSANNFFEHTNNKNIDAYTLWRQIVHKEDVDVLILNDSKVSTGAINHFTLEYRIVDKNQHIRWILDRGVVIEKNANGLPQKIIGTHTDITAIKLTEAALQESEQRWQFALEGSGDGIWDWKTTQDIVYFSKPWKKMLGYAPDDIGENITEWQKRIHPEDAPAMQDALLKYLSGELPAFYSEHRMLCKDGTYKWVLSRGMITDRTADNKPTRMIGTQTDINYIKQTEVELSQRVNQFQGLSENIPGVIFEYESRPDGSHLYRYLSPAMGKIFGIKPSSIFKLTQFIHPNDLDEMEATLAKAADTLAPFYLESRLILPGKGVVWRSMSCSFSYKSATGGKVFTGLMLDISERKKADEKLNESENRLASLIANLQTGILMEDENHQIVLTNELFCKMFGLNRNQEEIRGMDYTEIIEQVKHLFNDPEYFAERVVTLLEFQQLTVNDIWELKDGRVFSLDFIPIYNNKVYRGHLWKYTDVTTENTAVNALRISEEKYRGIIANMNLGLLEIDTEENILFANQCFCDMCGFELDELIGSRAAQLFLKGENIELMERKNEERKRNTTDAYEIVVKNKRGQVRWWLISGAPRHNENGELIGSIGIHLDITAQKELEYELTIAREQAEQSTRSKEVFLANMSHEIRTPMNAILGMSNQLSKTTLNNKQQFYLDTINSASENLLVIINDILDLSKIEAGKLSLEKIAFEPLEVIKRAMQVLLHKAEEKGLVLTNSAFDETVSPVLIGDPYRLNQVFLNIISNAIKFTERGRVDIDLKVIKDMQDDQLLRVTIKDTGIGMDEPFVKSLFEKFSQEDASVTRQYGGTGLGMSICKELIELMGGAIKATSIKGVGTSVIFEVTFPKGIAADLPSKETFVANESMLAGKKILVVDDNEMNRLVATTILNNYGAETVEAGNGYESVEYLMKNLVDLVLMDIQMPVMNGFEATKIIRNVISKTMPIIALTANAIKGDNEKCLEAGMNDYMSKPFKEEDLLRKIATSLLAELPENTIAVNKPVERPVSYYDISEIKIISRGNEEFVKKMLKMFIDQTPAHLSEMRSKLQSNQLTVVGEIAHRIKPTIDNMGIVTLKATIREIEKIGKSGADNGALNGLMEKVETDISFAIEAIKSDYQLA